MSASFKVGEKVWTFVPYTRGMARQVQDKLMEGVKISTSEGKNVTDIPPTNGDRADELKVRLVTNMTQEEIDGLDNKDYEKCLAEVEKYIEKKSA